MAELPVPGRSVGRVGVRPDRDEAIDVLFRTHCASLVRLAMVLLGDRAEAEEVVQDAFVSLHRNWAGLRDPGAAGASCASPSSAAAGRASGATYGPARRPPG